MGKPKQKERSDWRLKRLYWKIIYSIHKHIVGGFI